MIHPEAVMRASRPIALSVIAAALIALVLYIGVRSWQSPTAARVPIPILRLEHDVLFAARGEPHHLVCDGERARLVLPVGNLGWPANGTLSESHVGGDVLGLRLATGHRVRVDPPMVTKRTDLNLWLERAAQWVSADMPASVQQSGDSIRTLLREAPGEWLAAVVEFQLNAEESVHPRDAVLLRWRQVLGIASQPQIRRDTPNGIRAAIVDRPSQGDTLVLIASGDGVLLTIVIQGEEPGRVALAQEVVCGAGPLDPTSVRTGEYGSELRRWSIK